jgi:hypothetical protein
MGGVRRVEGAAEQADAHAARVWRQHKPKSRRLLGLSLDLCGRRRFRAQRRTG